MAVPTIFETCKPRPDVLSGAYSEADFAADLASVLSGRASANYRDPVEFFANTYPTRGLKSLLSNVCRRLSGVGDAVSAIFRLDTSYGGGKTHSLIALTHAARGMNGVSDVGEFIDPSLLPTGNVRVAVFDGENADPANGRALGGGVLAFTPWGEIAYALAGKPGYERVRQSDEDRVAPGSETIRNLFGDDPTLILLDELAVYLRKVRLGAGGDQLTAFLSSLFKAVESAPRAAVVFTLAIGKDGSATDAYSEENQFVARRMAEIESAVARKATLLNPTEEDETVKVIRRRLFESIDQSKAATVVETYRNVWNRHDDSLDQSAGRPETTDRFRASYPLHPDVLQTLTGKTATLANFQRVRGMLRLLARTVAFVWDQRPADATAIHLHHVNPGHESIRQEIVTRLGQSAFVPAIANDIAGGQSDKKALAEEIDAELHQGMPPYASYVARTIFIHTLAFNDPLKGLSPEELRFALACPSLDLSFIEESRKKFVERSAYLDDRPAAPMRFLAEANLTQIIRREEQHVAEGDMRTHLDDRIREIFAGDRFDLIAFPGGPFDVPDEVGSGRPSLVVLAYEGLTVGDGISEVPSLIESIHSHKGSDGSALRKLRNNLVFVVADEGKKKKMQGCVRRRLALMRLKAPERLAEFASHQQSTILEFEARSQHDLAVAIQQCYGHVFYPSKNRLGTRIVDLDHTAIDIPSASDQPGAGQLSIARKLREFKKLRFREDEPDAPTYVQDRTPLGRKGEITTMGLRGEFRRDPSLPILLADDVFIKGVRLGVNQGDYVYRRGDLLFGPGDPPCEIRIDEQAVVMTMAYAKEKGIWPRNPEPPPPPPPTPPPPTPPPPEPPGPIDPVEFTAEGLLKDALAQLWEQARDNQVDSIGTLRISLYEPIEPLRIFGSIGSVPDAKKTVAIEGDYETNDGGEFEFEFHGPVTDAQPVREFLEPQLRAAASKNIETTFTLEFDQGLSIGADGSESLANRLTRFVNCAASVTAIVRGET